MPHQALPRPRRHARHERGDRGPSRAEETERTRQLEEARRAAEAANRAKDEFLAMVSHELKTPLTSMLAAAEVLRSQVTREERARALEVIERNIHARAKLIDDLLDLSCISTATLRLDLCAVEPASVIKTTIEGLGVGLALVKNLVELHGGSVHAESPGEEKGATFTVDLSLAGSPPEKPTRPEARERGEERALAGIRVVIVDDDPDHRDLLQFLLEGYGAEVTAAASAAEALAALERSMPDVLLSDVAMPGESGYDLMRKVAALPAGGVLPAAALSAYSNEQDRQQALAAGFRMLLAKPIVPKALVAAVAGLAGRTLTKDPGTARTRWTPPRRDLAKR